VTHLGSTLFRRLVIGIALVSVVAIATAATFLYLRYGAINDRFREGTLRNFAATLVKRTHGEGAAFGVDLRHSTLRALRGADGRFAVVAQDGRILAASEGQTEPLIPLGNAQESYFELAGGTAGAPQYGLSVRYERPAPFFVQVAFPINDVIYDSILEEFVLDIGWLWLPFVGAVLATFVAVARIALKPLSRAAEDAGEIGPKSVGRRLREDGLPDDVLVLVRAVNSALDRMQDGYESLETFVSDVAHELRTPLAIVKARVAMADGPLAREIAQDFAPMERLVEQLLDHVRLGRIQFEPHETVDLTAVATDVGRFCAPLAVSRGRLIAVEGAPGPVLVAGARDYIFRALRNLVDNALNHAPPGSTVVIRPATDGSVAVLDRGPGFPPDKLDPVARMAARGSSDRREGLGLGLSIVERTMTAHGGSLELANLLDGGAIATMRFPAVFTPAEDAAEPARRPQRGVAPLAPADGPFG